MGDGAPDLAALMSAVGASIAPWLMPSFAIAASVLIAVATILTALHALRSRREVSATLAWIGLILLSPVIGLVLYWAFGVNRVSRRAKRLRAVPPEPRSRRRGCDDTPARDDASAPPGQRAAPDQRGAPPGAAVPPEVAAYFAAGARLSRFPVAPVSDVRVLERGADAYDAMLAAIDQARRRVWLASYWFAPDATGERFIDALARARRRGADVRVLVDAVGILHRDHSRRGLVPWRSVVRRIKRRGLTVARFNPLHPPRRFSILHLRSHRKLLIVDDDQLFIGGMNVHDGHQHERVRDLHLAIVARCDHGTHPLIASAATVFSEDWAFATGEWLDVSQPGGACPPSERDDRNTPLDEDVASRPTTTSAAAAAHWARLLPDGPDEDYEVLPLIRVAALQAARESVQIVTPYFLPDTGLMAALKACAMRGVRVEVFLPARSDHRIVDWAARPALEELLERRVVVWLTPPPFLHAKLMRVDDRWALLGSSNWDPRSLRLNFELDIELGGATLATLGDWVARQRASAERLELATLADASSWTRLRDAIARLPSPYL